MSLISLTVRLSDMDVRTLKQNDIPQLLAIEHSVQSAPWSTEVFQLCLKAGYYAWVVELDELILGFIIVSVYDDECHILNLGVTRQYQCQGVGQTLLQYALAKASQLGAKIAYLEVRETNQPARNLYQKFQFAAVGRRKDYYPAPQGREDALVLVKDLSSAEVTSPAKLDKLTAKIS